MEKEALKFLLEEQHKTQIVTLFCLQDIALIFKKIITRKEPSIPYH